MKPFEPSSLHLMSEMAVKIFPLYAVMALGFLFGRIRPAASEPLSFLQIYFIVPIVVASSIANLEFQTSYLLLPVLTYLGCSLVGGAALWCGQKIWCDNTPNIFSYACGCANTGYYGIPVALIIFPQEIIGIFMMAVVGFTLFEATLGYYWVARGHYTIGDSLWKLVRLPLVYAFILGVVLSAIGQHVPDAAKDIVRDFRGFYVVAGALMIGLGLSRLKKLDIEAKLIAFVFAFKFFLWPLLALALIVADNQVAHLFREQVHKILLLLAIMPLPANAVAFSLQLNVQPDKASTQVFFSTVFALIYIPVIMALWG